MKAAAYSWSTYEYQPSFILGFHGCDKALGERVLLGQEAHLRWSAEDYDWLGHGIYFWEGSPTRAFEWACQRQSQGKITTPFVLGAIIDLRHCLDLFDRYSLDLVKTAHRELGKTVEKAGVAMPVNVGKTPDKLGRKLDCAVINYLHTYQEQRAANPFDSIRSPFFEGTELYPGAGFRNQNHIQICVRNLDCIKGYFRPVEIVA